MSSSSRSETVLIAGAGPAGLAAAHALARRGVRTTIVERQRVVGGLSRTERYRGFRFDIGGHRFLTQVPQIESLWREVLGRDLLTVRRLSRIHYNGRFFDYPLRLGNLARNIHPLEGARIAGSYLRAQLARRGPEETFEQWVTNRFGDRLYRTFFKTYTEKVWGIPCHEIRADWAAQRIRNLSLLTSIRGMIVGGHGVKSLAEEFLYPRLGPGQMWERFAELAQQAGSQLQLESEVTRIRVERGRVRAALVTGQGKAREVAVSALVSSLPLPHLIAALDPPAAPEVLEAARRLSYRDFIVVNLILRGRDHFPDNWIYVHTPSVRVGRIQNYRNWSDAMVPDASCTTLGMEYFCSVGDDLWTMSDPELLALARTEVEALGLARGADAEDGYVIRERRAYPVYDESYREMVEAIRPCVDGIQGLFTVGRNGMHRYNNQDHAMLTGILAAENVLGAGHDLWQVNTERSYYEEQRTAASGR